jgi:formylglycine-generating enzyme required for sulfatase activity
MSGEHELDMKHYISLVFIAFVTCWVLPGCNPIELVSPTITLLPSQTATQPPTLTATISPSFTPTSTPTLSAGATAVSEQDGMVMVYVPGGDFSMGSTDGGADEQPVHTVTLDAYWIDRTEVTNGMYALCVQAGDCSLPASSSSSSRSDYYGNPLYADYPVIHVDWNAAQAYCGWAGRQLPTEAEWEKAARGQDGRGYPWGNIYWDLTFACVGDTTAVGSYPSGASPYGALDMAGNVWEWVADWYAATYYEYSPSSNPPGPDSGVNRILRGGAWFFDGYRSRSAYRFSYHPDLSGDSIGIRCASSTP